MNTTQLISWAGLVIGEPLPHPETVRAILVRPGIPNVRLQDMPPGWAARRGGQWGVRLPGGWMCYGHRPGQRAVDVTVPYMADEVVYAQPTLWIL